MESDISVTPSKIGCHSTVCSSACSSWQRQNVKASQYWLFVGNPSDIVGFPLQKRNNAGKKRIAKFMGPTWGPPGSCRPQMGPMLAPWSLLSGTFPRRGICTFSTIKSCSKLCPTKIVSSEKRPRRWFCTSLSVVVTSFRLLSVKPLNRVL